MISQTTEYRGHIIEFRIDSGADPIGFDQGGTPHWHYTGIHRFTVKAATSRIKEGEDLLRGFILSLVEQEDKEVNEEREKWRDWGSFYWNGGTLWASQADFAPAIVKGFPLVKLKLAAFNVVSVIGSSSDCFIKMEAEGILSAYYDLTFSDLTPKLVASQEAEYDDEYFDQDDMYD